MSIYDKATLVQIPSGYKASGAKLYSVLPANGDGDFTVSADADATRIDENGLIESTAANQARLSRNFIDGVVQPDPFLLLEPTRTNLQVRSEEFDNISWTKANSTVSANEIISPDGALSGDKLIANTTAGSHYVQGTVSGLSTSSEATFSVFVKKGEITQLQLLCAQNSSPFTNWARLQFDLNTFSEFSTNIGTFGYEDYGNGWVRVFVTGTPTSTSALIRVSLYKNFSNAFAGNNIDGFYVFGAQLEQGNYPTSYIPTTSSAVTRTIDYASGAGDINTFNDSEGTLFIDAAALGNDGTVRIINISDGTSSNRVLIQLGNNNNQIRADLISGGVTQTSLSTTSYTFTDFNKIAFKYKGDDTALFVNGTQVGATQIGKTMPTGLDRIDFTNGSLGSTFYFRGKLKQLMYFETALSDAELIQLTS